MKNLKVCLLVGLSVALSGCYSFSYTHADSVFGSSKSKAPATQSLNVTTTPAGASCNVTSYQNATTKTTQYVLSTPGSVNIPQSKQPIIVTCSKTGYQDVQQALQPASDGSFPSSVNVTLTQVAASVSSTSK